MILQLLLELILPPLLGLALLLLSLSNKLELSSPFFGEGQFPLVEGGEAGM